MVLHLLQGGGRRKKGTEIVSSGEDGASSNMVIRSEDDSAVGSSDAFLSAQLRFTTDKHGQELCLVRSGEGDEEVGVMMGWEKGISELLIPPRINAAEIVYIDKEIGFNLNNHFSAGDAPFNGR